jgi:hypothetical protein
MYIFPSKTIKTNSLFFFPHTSNVSVKGYVKRQALFACMTCNNNGQLTGICAACAYHCHANHEINELYTKR